MSPRSPPVQETTSTSTPSPTYFAIVAAPLLDSSSGCACTAISRSRSPTCTPAHVLEPVVIDNGVSRRRDLVPHHVTVPAGAPTEGLPVPLPRPAPGTAKWWVLGVVGCLLGTALAIWWGLASTLGQVTWTDLGYAHVTDRSISVTYDVHRPTDRDVSCVVQALDNRPRHRRGGDGHHPGRRRGVGAPRHAREDHHEGGDRRGAGLQRPARRASARGTAAAGRKLPDRMARSTAPLVDCSFHTVGLDRAISTDRGPDPLLWHRPAATADAGPPLDQLGV